MSKFLNTFSEEILVKKRSLLAVNMLCKDYGKC